MIDLNQIILEDVETMKTLWKFDSPVLIQLVNKPDTNMQAPIPSELQIIRGRLWNVFNM